MSGMPLGVAPAGGRTGRGEPAEAGPAPPVAWGEEGAHVCPGGIPGEGSPNREGGGRGHGAAVTWVPATAGRRRRRRRRSSPAPGLGRSLGRRRGLARGAQRAPCRPGRRRHGPRPPCPSAGPGRPPPPHGPGRLRLRLPGGRPAAGASPRTAPGSAHPPRRPALPAPRAAAKLRGGRPGPRESEREHGLRHPGRSVKATTTGAVLLLPTCRGGHWACANADHIRIHNLMNTVTFWLCSLEI
ncbi:uncharacterized protein [Notamacropus eugenii]|uniref:uncharacterized protein isoform X2 n=1 Tax=Notamacropus eugenii TaxID=9315 RepID=UPI003B678968